MRKTIIKMVDAVSKTLNLLDKPAVPVFVMLENLSRRYRVGEGGIKFMAFVCGSRICVGSEELAMAVSWEVCSDSIIIAELAIRFVD
jgi:hypothetical protein